MAPNLSELTISKADRLSGVPVSPAPSPIPSMRLLKLGGDPASPEPDSGTPNLMATINQLFRGLSDSEKSECLQHLLRQCSRDVLVETSNYIQPMLRHDPFKVLPWEISLRILSYIKDPKSLAAASQVSRLWYLVLSDDYTWKQLCEAHHFRRLSAAGNEIPRSLAANINSQAAYRYGTAVESPSPAPETQTLALSVAQGHAQAQAQAHPQFDHTPIGSFGIQNSHPPHPPNLSNLLEMLYNPEVTRYVVPTSYRSHFRQQYLLNSAWETGGRVAAHYVLQNTDEVIVTDLLMEGDYIILALDNSKILVFAQDGQLLSSLCGHVMGVWALALYGDTLVSGGCDRDVRVWDLRTMLCTRILQGHTSTVRCLAMAGPNIALSGARDNSVRVWDLQNGTCLHHLQAHTAAVRCLKTSGDYAVSASYDCSVCVWRISTGELVHTLTGHQAQIYSLAVDGPLVATGGLDACIFVWNIETGECKGQLQGHVALVGQLQLRGTTLVSASSDGAIRVWDVERMVCRHRIIAHDNAVTCLQFDDERIVSGGPDGRVHVWSLATGKQVRTLGPQCTTVWGIAFRNDRLVLVGSQGSDTVIELISFVPN